MKEVEVHDSGVKFAGIKRERESWSEQWVRKIILILSMWGYADIQEKSRCPGLQERRTHMA